MRFEAFVAARYLRGKRKSRFISLITIISIAGVSVGVMALIVVMSVMTGFDIELRKTVIGHRAHLLVRYPRRRPMEDPDAVIKDVMAHNPEVVAASPLIEVLGLIKTEATRGQDYAGAMIRGVDVLRETDVTHLEDNLTEKNGREFGRGRLPGDKEIVLGYVLAHELGAYIGDRVGVMTANQRVGAFRTRPTILWLTVSGLSQAQMIDYDSMYAYVNLETARQLKGITGVDGVHCRLTDPFLAPAVSERIDDEMDEYRTVTWYESQQAFFEALQQEKVVMFVILAFIILVAAFNITSTLIMVVMEKRRDVGILRTLGVGSRSILQLFMLEGLYIGLSGTLSGLALGTLFAYKLNAIAEWLAGLLGVNLFNSQIYYFDRIPVAVMWPDVMWITISAVILTFLSTVYPAWSATRFDVVDALRYE